MMRPRGVSCSSSPLAAVSLLLLLGLCFFFHCAAAARPLPATTVSFTHHENDGVKAASVELVLQEAVSATGNGDEVSELMGAEAESEEEACSEGKDDECMQRRLLRDAHLDYIYTQHKGKP